MPERLSDVRNVATPKGSEKYHSVRTVPKSNRKIADTGKFYTSNILVIFQRQFNKKWRGETCFINSNSPL
jgi:hypothetical protein